MNILDQIIDTQAAPAPPAENINLTHSFRDGDPITESGRAHLSRAVRSDGYRKLGVDVSTLNNDPIAIAEAAGLTWNPVKVQAAAIGPHGGTVEVPNNFFLFKSGTKEPLPVQSVSDVYIPHKNSELIGALSGAASEAGLTVVRAGSLVGGSRIWLAADSGIADEISVGDVITLQAILSSGHGNGQSTRVSFRTVRLKCSNGAFLTECQLALNVSHRVTLGSRIQGLTDALVDALGAFRKHTAEIRALDATPATPGILRLALAQFLLAKDADFAAIVRRITQSPVVIEGERRIGADVIERLLEVESYRSAAPLFEISGARLLRDVIEATDNQIGAGNTRALSHAYNGLTFHQSHVAGRNDEAAFAAQLRPDRAGQFRRLLVDQYVPALQQVYGRA